MATYQRYLQRLNAHLKVAKAYADLSYARRLKVGAVLLKDDRVIAVGYNGMPSGMNNNCEYETGVILTSTTPQAQLATRPELVHAEMNAIAFAAKNGVATKNCIMVITHSPCFECSKLLMQAGVKEIYYETEYRITESLDFLRANNIIVERIPNGPTTKKTRTSSTTSGQTTTVSKNSYIPGDVRPNPKEQAGRSKIGRLFGRGNSK